KHDEACRNVICNMKLVARRMRTLGDRHLPHPTGVIGAATGDLAEICDQNAFEHARVCLATLGGGNLARRAGGNNSVVQQNATEATVYVHPAGACAPPAEYFQPEYE